MTTSAPAAPALRAEEILDLLAGMRDEYGARAAAAADRVSSLMQRGERTEAGHASAESNREMHAQQALSMAFRRINALLSGGRHA